MFKFVACLPNFLPFIFSQNIFLGEDIRKQLPRESAEFDDVNANWKVRQSVKLNAMFCHLLLKMIYKLAAVSVLSFDWFCNR